MNEQPQDVMDAITIAFGQYRDWKGLEGYGSNVGKWDLARLFYAEGPVFVFYDYDNNATSL